MQRMIDALLGERLFSTRPQPGRVPAYKRYLDDWKRVCTATDMAYSHRFTNYSRT